MGYFDERADWCLERNLCPQWDCDYLKIRLVDGVCPRCGYICETHKDLSKARKPVCGECERLKELNKKLRIRLAETTEDLIVYQRKLSKIEEALGE